MLRFCTGSLLAALLIVAAPGVAWAQTYLTHTTLSSAVTATATTVTVASATNVAAGSQLLVDLELLDVTAVSGTTATVRRGAGGGGSPAVAHASGTPVWVVSSTQGLGFTTYDVSGTCTQTGQQYLPHINTRTGAVFDCEAGLWLRRNYADPVFVREGTVRENFDGAYFVHQDDMSVKSVTDDEDNIVQGSPLGAIEYREELTKTTSSWITTAGRLDISADDTTDDEGVEILFGSVELGTWMLAGTNGGCIAASVTIADISATDQVQLGFRDNGAFPDAANYAGLTIWNSVGPNANDGSIVSSQEVSEATDTDDSGVDWADGETRALKVCISEAGVPTAFYSDAYTYAQAVPDFPDYNAITMAETGSTLTAAQAMTPFFSYLAAGTDGADVFVNWVELTRVP
jgi:hypothetical protein